MLFKKRCFRKQAKAKERGVYGGKQNCRLPYLRVYAYMIEKTDGRQPVGNCVYRNDKKGKNGVFSVYERKNQHNYKHADGDAYAHPLGRFKQRRNV